MVTQADVDKMKLRQNYNNAWHSDLFQTFQADTPYFCFSLFCAPCASYLLRKRALYNDMSRYVCCAGYMPCSGRCGERHCPGFCLATEVCCCFVDSVASTRFLIQDEFHLHTTTCDICIIGFIVCLNVTCIVESKVITEASQAQVLSCLAKYVYCTVCACMQTQHKVEMDKRDVKFRPQQPTVVPPFQQMSRIDQPYPPAVGYPAPAPGNT